MSAGAQTQSVPAGAATLRAQAERRRTFAIISHPDAGKTTLSEKLLLYAGAIEEAGAVKARRQRAAATSDWMEMERERGISISSTVLRFEFEEHIFNLLDTPGHRDFSEDTLRVLAAADSAVILLDAARGVEAQTLKLFQVAHERRIPLITFVNKFDRPALEPLALIDELEAELGLKPAPVTWPVGGADEFAGVFDRRDGAFHRFERTARGASIGAESVLSAEAAASQEGYGWPEAREEIGLLDAVGADLDPGAYMRGEATPVFFGSALSNFGVRLLLRALISLAPSPGPMRTTEGAARELEEPFSGLVFKVQSNLDPRHRDRLAFVRVCSGRFERGMKVLNARSGQALGTSYAHELFGRERQTLDEAYPGDVVGLANAGDVRVGDTLHTGREVRFPAPPTTTPDRFVRLRNADSGRFKQFRRGLEQLQHEGVVHVLHEPVVGEQVPILAGAGPLQFEVASYRMDKEFGALVRMEPLEWTVSRRVDAAGRKAVEAWSRGEILAGPDFELAVFRDRYELERFERSHAELELSQIL